jgi:hypothetical protein
MNHILIPSRKKDKKPPRHGGSLNVFAIDDIKMMTGFEVEPVIAGETEIKAVQSKYFGGGSAAGGASAAGADMQEIINSMGGVSGDNLEVVEEKEDIDIAKLEAAGEDARSSDWSTSSSPRRSGPGPRHPHRAL